VRILQQYSTAPTPRRDGFAAAIRTIRRAENLGFVRRRAERVRGHPGRPAAFDDRDSHQLVSNSQTACPKPKRPKPKAPGPGPRPKVQGPGLCAQAYPVRKMPTKLADPAYHVRRGEIRPERPDSGRWRATRDRHDRYSVGGIGFRYSGIGYRVYSVHPQVTAPAVRRTSHAQRPST